MTQTGTDSLNRKFKKYVAKIKKSLADVEMLLETPGFSPTDADKMRCARGKVFGDFSAAWVKLTVRIERKEQGVLVESGFFGVYFDNGNLWQLAREVTQSRLQ